MKTEITTQSEFLNVVEAAEFLRVKIATIYAWVHQRRIPFRRHGRRTIFSRKDLEAWSESQAISPVNHEILPSALSSAIKTSLRVKTRAL